MNTWNKQYALLLVCALLSGCQDAMDLPPGDAREQAEQPVKRAVYEYIVRDFATRGGSERSTAFFVSEKRAFEQELLEVLAGYRPPVKAGEYMAQTRSGAVVDMQTKGPAILLTVTVRQIRPDAAVAVGQWNVGEGKDGVARFLLTRAGPYWRVAKVERETPEPPEKPRAAE